MTSSSSSTTTANNDIAAFSINSLLGIDFVRSSVVAALKKVFDLAKIAKGATIAKLDKKKKNKNKKQPEGELELQQTEATEEVPLPMFEEEQAAVDSTATTFSPANAMVTLATKSKFGDYQCNTAMFLLQFTGLNPREWVQRIAEALEPKLEGVAELPLEIAGPGFITLNFREDYLRGALGCMTGDREWLGVPLTECVQLNFFVCV